MCPNNGVAASICAFNMHTDADACNCTQGLYGYCKSLHWKLTLGKKSLAAPGTQIHDSIAPGFSAGHSTYWAILLRTQLSLYHLLFFHRATCLLEKSESVNSVTVNQWKIYMLPKDTIGRHDPCVPRTLHTNFYLNWFSRSMGQAPNYYGVHTDRQIQRQSHSSLSTVRSMEELMNKHNLRQHGVKRWHSSSWYHFIGKDSSQDSSPGLSFHVQEVLFMNTIIINIIWQYKYDFQFLMKIIPVINWVCTCVKMSVEDDHFLRDGWGCVN